MISVNIIDSDLSEAVKSLLSLCSLNSANIVICDETGAADITNGSDADGIVVLYKKGAYLYSDVHGKLSSAYGSKYRTISTPLDFREFCEAVMTLHRDVKITDSDPDHQTSGTRDTVTVSEEQCVIRYGERTVQLTEREMGLFICLRAHCGKTVSREMLKNEVWGNRTDEGTNIVDVYISYLRRKICPILGEGAIISVRGQGYMLNLPRK